MHQSGALTDRFRVERKLAAGSFGVVYLAHDRQRGADVALKVLREATGLDLYRFKREFRGLADIAHPNLVTLHELHHTGEQWFFTMEYVPGGSFLDWLRPKREGQGAAAPEPEAMLIDAVASSARTMQLPKAPPRKSTDRPTLLADRVERALYQLVDGVYALHVTGRLHRDIKPSNVRVTPEGRLVLLDFGLTSDVRRLSAEHTHAEAAVGTPLYMSPEQSMDQQLGPASDWYSVGVMLFEAVTGRRPFDGPQAVVLERKRSENAPSPRELVPDVPEYLDELCRKLLARDPAQRPEGQAILAILGRTPSPATTQLAAGIAPKFVGRRTELAALGQAFQDTRTGKSVAVIVRGSSGMGKSALVRQFLDEVAVPAGAVVLEGRCYERESVPYKGLDSVIDGLTTYLVQQPAARLESLLPRDIQALARLFPVLRRIPAIADPTTIWLAPPDPHELRRRAFSALRWLLHRLAQSVALVVYVDDVQWGDADASSFLSDLVLHPEPPAMLLIASCRLEEEESSLLVQALRNPRLADTGQVREMVLGGFTSHEADELVASVVGARGADTEVEAMLRESRGNPLFLSELARARGDRKGATSLDDLLSHRVEQLADDAHRLFEVCAVAGHPMPIEVALRAAGLAGEGTALATCQRERLLRLRSRGQRLVEPYHDRVRESAVARLSPERLRELHRLLAESIEASGHRDPESLATHWRGAGDETRAARWGMEAARSAMATYAFNRATLLFSEVLESPELSQQDRHASRVGLAHALSSAGRLDEAAPVFDEAANESDGTEQIELRRLQLDQVLRRGKLVEGRALARQVLRSVDLGMPSTRRRALLDLVLSRVILKVRGLEFTERPASEIPVHLLQRLDVLWSMSSGLSMLDPIVGRALQSRYMRLALQVGEPERTAHALGLEIGYRALAGESSWPVCEELRARGLVVAERLRLPQLAGFVENVSGLAATLSGRFEVGLERLVKGIHAMRDLTVGRRFEIDVGELMRIGCLLYLGRIREMSRLMAVLVREAEEGGDVAALRSLRGWRGNVCWLLQDQPKIARRNLEAAATPRGNEYTLPHYYEFLSAIQNDLYTGEVDSAASRMKDEWSQLEGSMLLRIQSVRIESRHLRGRVALARGSRHPEGSPERRRDCELARKMAKQIDHEGTSWGHALAMLLRAGASDLAGAREEAQLQLREAIDACSAAHMMLYANTARRCLGLLIGGDTGHALIREAEVWMTAEGIRVPAAVSALMTPGCATHA